MKNMRKRKNAGYQHFLFFFFPRCFKPNQRQKSSFWLISFSRLQILPIWTNLEFCHLVRNQVFPKRQNLDSSKLKEFADDNFRFKENGRKLSKLVENTVGKGEIARFDQFLLCPQCFQKASTVWERVNYKIMLRDFVKYLNVFHL